MEKRMAMRQMLTAETNARNALSKKPAGQTQTAQQTSALTTNAPQSCVRTILLTKEKLMLIAEEPAENALKTKSVRRILTAPQTTAKTTDAELPAVQTTKRTAGKQMLTVVGEYALNATTILPVNRIQTARA